MGIQGLLPLLKSIHRATELKKFSGETLAVDAYGWLHRGAIGCALELAQAKPTSKYVDFAMHRVRMLKHFGVTPYIVFDGDFLPSKARTEASRAKRREDSRKAGMDLLKAGKPGLAQAELQKAIDVTPEMARHLIEELKKINVPYIVAPYEADAQMVYLERKGLVSGIVSEDSDLLVFGAKRLLTKLDQYGNCVEINRRDFCACREVSLTGWTDAQFRQMTIFSGCDYLEGLPNMGLKTSYRMLRKCKTPERMIQVLRFEGKHKISEDYLAAYKQAELTFVYQRVFCPEKQELVLLTELDATSPLGIEDMPYIGAKVDNAFARAVAIGDVNPITKQTIIVEPVPGRRHKADTNTKRKVEPPPLKTNKPIDMYFGGPRRVPLGEMDRNCFSVNAKEVAELTQNGLTPRVFPLPRPYLDEQPNAATSTASTRSNSIPSVRRRRTEPISRTLSALEPSITDANRRRTLGTMRTALDSDGDGLVNARPAKKARLCNVTAQSDDSELEQSKFFGRTNLKCTSTEVADPYLRSDDSVVEALSSLPDLDEWPVPRGRSARDSIEILRDEVPMPVGDTSPAASHGTMAGSAIRVRPDLPASDVPTPPRVSPRSTTNRVSKTPQVCNARTSITARGLGMPASSLQESGAKVVGKGAPFTPTRSALQSIGARALQRGTPTSSPSPRIGGLVVTNAPASRLSLSHLVFDPASVPLPNVTAAERVALSRPVGSEDQIIPDGDEENEPEITSPIDASPKPKHRGGLDLSRYLCT